MGREIAPHSALFNDGSVMDIQAPMPDEAPEAVVADVSDSASMDFDADSLTSFEDDSTEVLPTQEVNEASVSTASSDDLEFDLSGFDLNSPTEAAAETAPQDDMLPMDMPEAATDDLDLASIDLGDSLGEPEASPQQEVAEDDGALDFDLSGLSLDDESADAAEDPAFEADTSADNGLAGINPADSLTPVTDQLTADDSDLLDIEATEASEPDLDQFAAMTDEDGTAGESSADEEEISVKLDLARAYLDMGEPEMARTLLDEVVEMGNTQQQQEAKDLIARAG